MVVVLHTTSRIGILSTYEPPILAIDPNSFKRKFEVQCSCLITYLNSELPHEVCGVITRSSVSTYSVPAYCIPVPLPQSPGHDVVVMGSSSVFI